jgi:hypothetical protein
MGKSYLHETLDIDLNIQNMIIFHLTVTLLLLVFTTSDQRKPVISCLVADYSTEWIEAYFSCIKSRDQMRHAAITFSYPVAHHYPIDQECMGHAICICTN